MQWAPFYVLNSITKQNSSSSREVKLGEGWCCSLCPVCCASWIVVVQTCYCLTMGKVKEDGHFGTTRSDALVKLDLFGIHLKVKRTRSNTVGGGRACQEFMDIVHDSWYFVVECQYHLHYNSWKEGFIDWVFEQLFFACLHLSSQLHNPAAVCGSRPKGNLADWSLKLDQESKLPAHNLMKSIIIAWLCFLYMLLIVVGDHTKDHFLETDLDVSRLDPQNLPMAYEFQQAVQW